MIGSFQRPEPTITVIFGGVGDLSRRKLIPALYNLYINNWLPEQFEIIAASYHDRDTDAMREQMHEEVSQHSRNEVTRQSWSSFAKRLHYFKLDFKEQADYEALHQRINNIEHEWGVSANRLFYFSVSPSFYRVIAEHLGREALVRNENLHRVIIEKPIGHDLASAKALNDKMKSCFKESQIFRIDHYLGKETVQNIMAFRFANAIFEPLWNRNHIDNIQITVAEEVSVEERGRYYDQSGALRDMVQNHILQLLTLVAMEPPVTYGATEIMNRKVDVLNAIRKFTPEDVKKYAVRGQYYASDDGEVPEYRGSRGVPENSNTETYAAMRLLIDNWRWKDVPFYVRTGKSMPAKYTYINVQFKPVTHQLFPNELQYDASPNFLVMNIQPEMNIKLCFQAKEPGLTMNLYPATMQFDYSAEGKAKTPEAYETLLLDAMKGNGSLFMRSDQVEVAWELMMPILNEWENNKASDFPNYKGKTWGPKAAEDLLAQDNRRWFQ